MFNVLEQRHAADFANGPTGVKYYNDLFEAVRAAEVPEALEEFQTRFLPLLDPDGTRSRASEAPPPKRGEARWLVATLSAVALLAGTILGINVLPRAAKTTPALPAEPTASTIAADPTPTASTIAADPTPTVSTVAVNPAPTTETIATDPTPTIDLSEATAEPPANSREPTEIRGDE
jgi:hypothetical protein